jgi:EAL and modified HD-GYP domain-containing signal transduction protein
VHVVAEKVESVTDFKRCVEHGFDLFQGYHLAVPELLERPARPAGRDSAVALHRTLVDGGDDIDVAALEAIVSDDPSLAFRLLVAVNANAFGLDQRVGSLDQAMSLLGPLKLRCLAELVATSADAIDPPDHRQHVARGATRARLAGALLADTDHAHAGVTAALLSTTDSIYGASMGELLAELPVAPEIADALLYGHGPLGSAIDLIRALEQGDRATVEQLAPGRHDELARLLADATAPAASEVDRIRS